MSSEPESLQKLKGRLVSFSILLLLRCQTAAHLGHSLVSKVSDEWNIVYRISDFKYLFSTFLNLYLVHFSLKSENSVIIYSHSSKSVRRK